ncbi:CGNR zinc finger domain-containing protein [Embleya sp. NPDC005971]|uniref:CGNR zinc finger domain-containing protein n=1 Tax=Embleya sp. NPDC005971 TaxID=3156724 RepID=UPI0033F93849
MRYILPVPSSPPNPNRNPNPDRSTRHSIEAVARRTVALVNALTGDDPATDQAPTTPSPESLAALLRAHGEPDPVELTPTDVTDLHAAAVLLRTVFVAQDVDTAASALNRLLRRGRGTLRLTSHDGRGPWHPHLDGDDDAPWGEWFLASSCLALTILVWDRQRPPGGVCASGTCRRVFTNEGSGRPRRYCSRRCATRERVAAHRRAHA